MFIVVAALLHVLLASAALAADFSGLVVSVLDGDTIGVLHNRHPERIRLSGIDCPEKGQPYGHQAKQATSAMVVTSLTHDYESTSTAPVAILHPHC